jgi:hypothetical protein
MKLAQKKAIIASTVLGFLPVVTQAAFTGFTGDNAAFGTGANTTPLGIFITNVVTFTNTILLPAVLAIAFFVFVWGIFQYFIVGGANDEKKEQGKSLMIYATLGFVFIVIFWGLVNFLANTIGLGGDQIQKVKTPFNFGTGTGVGGP